MSLTALSPDELSKRDYAGLQDRPGEPPDEATKRRAKARHARATGVLATLISGDRFMNEFNLTNAKHQVHLQLFTSTKQTSDTLLNPRSPMPTEPRFTKDQVMSWYGRKWTLRTTSAPVFEAGSVRYRAWVVGGSGALLSLAAATAVAWQTSGRRRETALAEQLRNALGRQERLSRDLHDGTLQSVYSVGLALQRAQRLLETKPDAAAGQLADTTRGLQRVVEELRAFIRETDPSAQEHVPLGEALHGLVAHLRPATETALHLEVAPGADAALTPAQSLQLLNIAREALSNSIRHSRARNVQIALVQASGVVRLELADDGCGFDPVKAQREGHGLWNLAVRVHELGARHRWDTTPGRGTRLMVELALPKPSPKKAS